LSLEFEYASTQFTSGPGLSSSNAKSLFEREFAHGEQELREINADGFEYRRGGCCRIPCSGY
jgi:hypothetical protein